MRVNILEAKNRLSQLIKSAQAGEEVVIANRGEPVARLVPVEKKSEQSWEPGDPKAILDWIDNHKLPAHAQRSAEEIDSDIAAERAAWD